MVSMRGVHVHRRSHVLLLCVAVAALATSACATAPQRPAVNVALAHVRSAELDATYTYYSTTLTQAGVEFSSGSGKLNEEGFRRIYAAGANLHRALTLAHAEQKLYLVAGTNLPAYDTAFAELKKARAELELTVERAYKHGNT